MIRRPPRSPLFPSPPLFRSGHPNAPGLLGEGENLEVDPPRRLVQSMRALWSEDVKKEGTSRVTWEIEPVGDSCRLTVTHEDRKSTRLNSSHGYISYAVFCLK